jgi:hypothetical protein
MENRKEDEKIHKFKSEDENFSLLLSEITVPYTQLLFLFLVPSDWE